jgi:chemotaxis protein MotB
MSRKRDGKGITIIRREEVIEGGHHGGAWKVAYADFVTAMMAFFLLMWLLAATTDEQRRGLADYFSPMNPMARGASGAGQPFGGKTPFETGQLVSDRGAATVIPGRANEMPEAEDAITETSMARRIAATTDLETTTTGAQPFDPTGKADKAPEAAATQAMANAATAADAPVVGDTDDKIRLPPDARALALVGARTQTAAALVARAAAIEAARKAEADRQERQSFELAAEQIRAAVRGDKLLEDMSRQIAIDQTPEGLRIQLLDEDRRSMFATGSSAMQDRARALLIKMAPVLAALPENISIAGHTDATPFRGGDKTNWELSSERANATRRLLMDAGLPEARFRSVTGNADRDPLLPSDPLAAANRRIAIVVLRQAQAPVAPAFVSAAPTPPAPVEPAAVPAAPPALRPAVVVPSVPAFMPPVRGKAAP